MIFWDFSRVFNTKSTRYRSYAQTDFCEFSKSTKLVSARKPKRLILFFYQKSYRNIMNYYVEAHGKGFLRLAKRTANFQVFQAF